MARLDRVGHDGNRRRGRVDLARLPRVRGGAGPDLVDRRERLRLDLERGLREADAQEIRVTAGELGVQRPFEVVRVEHDPAAELPQRSEIGVQPEMADHDPPRLEPTHEDGELVGDLLREPPFGRMAAGTEPGEKLGRRDTRLQIPRPVTRGCRPLDDLGDRGPLRPASQPEDRDGPQRRESADVLPVAEVGAAGRRVGQPVHEDESATALVVVCIVHDMKGYPSR